MFHFYTSYSILHYFYTPFLFHFFIDAGSLQIWQNGNAYQTRVNFILVKEEKLIYVIKMDFYCAYQANTASLAILSSATLGER